MRVSQNTAWGLLALFVVSIVAALVIAPGLSPLTMFADAAIIPKVAMLICLLLALAAAGLALARKAPAPLRLIAWAGPALGLLGAAYVTLNSLMALNRMGPVPFDVMAPGWAEALLTLSLGLLAGGLAVLGLSRARA